MQLDGVEYHSFRARGADAWTPCIQLLRRLREFSLRALFCSLLRRAGCTSCHFVTAVVWPCCRINFSLQHKGLYYLSRSQCVLPRSPQTTSIVSASHRSHVILPNIQPPCINTNNTMLIAAKPNYGKSLLVQSMLKRKRQYRCAFDHVYLVCPPASRKAFKSDVFRDH